MPVSPTAAAHPTPAARLDAAAALWLAEAAARAQALSADGASLYIALKPDRFVVHGVRGERSAMREALFAAAEPLDSNLLVAAVIAVAHQLAVGHTPPRPRRLPAWSRPPRRLRAVS
ncbi:MAG TPA: hypothetical protein VGG29_20785 [Caulobacteraceae bacterium]|jgi:hypothetical protein